MEVFCLTLHFLLLSLFLSSLLLRVIFFFLIVLTWRNFLSKSSNGFTEMYATFIKMFRLLLNFRKWVNFTVLRKNLVNELTYIQFHNYVHEKITYKLDDFSLASFCDWSHENKAFFSVTLYHHCTCLCLTFPHLYHKKNF